MAYISQHSGEEIDKSITDVNTLNNKIDTKISKSGDTVTGNLYQTYPIITPQSDDYCRLVYKDSDKTTNRAVMSVNSTNNFSLVEYDPTNTGYYTNYYLPAPDSSATANTSYPIVTKKNFLDIVYPVGSCITMSSNTNPSSKLGGTWSLIDKKFKPSNRSSTTNGTYITYNSTNCTEIKACYVKNFDHILEVQFGLAYQVELADTSLVLATLNFANLGISQLNYSLYIIGQTDGGNGFSNAQVTYNTGVVTHLDRVTVKGSSNNLTASNIYFHMICTIPTAYMLDSYCNQFIFQRTA